MSPVYELLTNVTGNLNKPVTLTLKFDTSKVKDGQHAAIYYFNEAQQRWIEIGGKVNGDVITAEVYLLAKFAVLVIEIKP
ncbi:hypothetical protein [Paenibacillus chungangensis]|uniref:Uncharacterized protein n=1 Tax=Paenibacillus chungangensis TaxID=696535 RepID=A0ABW3HTY9_9BACL